MTIDIENKFYVLCSKVAEDYTCKCLLCYTLYYLNTSIDNTCMCDIKSR